jgi:hypothetical protein
MTESVLLDFLQERFDHLDQRTEVLIAAMETLGGIVEVTNALTADLIKKMDEPPSSDLPGLIRQLVSSVNEIRDGLNELPANVARAVSTGEVK